jgi:hypothetical protein
MLAEQIAPSQPMFAPDRVRPADDWCNNFSPAVYLVSAYPANSWPENLQGGR